MRDLLLFDIDGTLLLSGGAGKRAMIAAFDDIFDIKNAFDGVHMYGRTDPEILRHGLANQGLEMNENNMQMFMNRYFELLPAEMEKPAKMKRILPGIEELLPRLQKMPNIFLGLLTGNWRQSAMVKLGFFNLDKYFEIGAFADDSEIRDELVPFAVERYRQKAGEDIKPHNVWIIGDTPRDVQCARPHGARTISVLTGWHSREDVVVENPDYIFQDLTDSDAFLKIFM